MTKALVEVKEWIHRHPGNPDLIRAEQALTASANAVQAHSYIDAARKAEFKKQYKKALDQYQEALYFLLNDKVDDVHQADLIAEVRNRIAALEKSVS